MGGSMTDKQPICLTIGGSDSGGGAGIQADLRIFEQFGIKGCSVITALTAQNPLEILRIEPVSLAQIDAELTAIFDYYDVAAVKTGMLMDAEHIAVISALLGEHHGGKPLVIDPVMVASSGRSLLNEGAVLTLKKALLTQATLVTPNLDEAAVFLNRPVNNTVEDATALMLKFGCAILLKGGHGDGDDLVDVLCEANGKVTTFVHARQSWSTEQAHGSGCRLASAITTGLAENIPLTMAVSRSLPDL